MIGGLQSAATTIAHAGSQEGVAIALSSLGAQAVLGVPAAELTDLSVESADLLGRAGDELWERLQHTSSWHERFDVCDELLGRRLGERRVPRELSHCWRTIVASGGRVSVARLAADVGYSRQHLARWFRERPVGSVPAIGIAIGAAVGAALDQPAAGIAIGVCAGAVAEAAHATSSTSQDDDADADT